MKYLMLEVPFAGMMRKTPVLFPDFLTHSIVAEALAAHPLMTGIKVLSAGEFSSTDLEGVELFGRSVSLGVESQLSDSGVLPMLDYTHGLV